MTLHEFGQIMTTLQPTPRFPVLFIGHGSPMNALQYNTYTKGWAELGKILSRPSAILSVSAHWLTEGTKVHGVEKPKTIHDFYGFPKELYDMRYDAPGSPRLAEETVAVLEPTMVTRDTDWGLDHGTWVPLLHMFPDATIPVFQMSIDVSRSHRAHYELATLLRSLREKGVLIIGSGNIVHNLGNITWEENAKPFEWAECFDERAAMLLADGNHDALIAYEKLGADAALSIPTPDHYWPLLYALGATTKNEPVSFPVRGIAHGSISMRAVQIG